MAKNKEKIKLAKYAVDLKNYRLPAFTPKGNRRGWIMLYPSLEDIARIKGLDVRECTPHRKGETRNLEYVRLTDDELEALFPDQFSWKGDPHD